MALQLADLHTYAWYVFATKGEGMSPEIRSVMDVITIRRGSMGIWSPNMTEQLLARLSEEEQAYLKAKTE